MIHLEEITDKNWRKVNKLSVASSQSEFVSNNCGILARAYVYRKHSSEAKAIYEEEELVGLLLYRDCEELNAYVLDQMMIDLKFQNRGYGKAALSMVIDELIEDGKYDRIVLCYCEGNSAAKILYESSGFQHTGEKDGNEIIMEMKISKF